MLNNLDTYADAGRRAGTASRCRDAATVSHWASWKRRAVALEKPEHRAAAEKAYRDGYAENATPTVAYFR